MEFSVFGRRRETPADESNFNNGIKDDQVIAVDPYAHDEIIESVLNCAATKAEAETIQPGNTFELPFDDIGDIGDVDLDVELSMQARKYDLLLVEIGAAAMVWQAISPSSIDAD